MRTWSKRIWTFLAEEDGATATEYAVMLGLIIVACIATVKTLGGHVNDIFNKVDTNLPAAQ